MRQFARSEIFIHEGDKDRDVFVILAGCAKVLGDTQDGRTNILAIRVAGDIVGELSALDDQPRSASVAAATALSARAIDWNTFDTYLKDFPRANYLLHQHVLAKLRQATKSRVTLTGGAVHVRLAMVLHQLATTYGREQADGLLIDIPLSQVECAEFIGASVPSIQRALAELRRLGLVKTGYRRTVVLNLDGLYAVATGQ
jgi:CRP/FNR family cyclic AMP-dependent transcriptional regulator